MALTRTVIAGGLKVAVVPKSYDGALLNQRVASISSSSSVLLPNFLFGYLSSPQALEYVASHVNTLMQPNLSIEDLRAMPVPVPDLAEQIATVEKLDEFLRANTLLESLYQRKLAALDELKKSLLHRAFNGDL